MHAAAIVESPENALSSSSSGVEGSLFPFIHQHSHSVTLTTICGKQEPSQEMPVQAIPPALSCIYMLGLCERADFSFPKSVDVLFLCAT